jgi:hypothetical protein
MEAVAMVVKQRMHNRSQTAKQVCLAPKQFSAWNGRSKAELEYLWRSPAAPEAINVVRRFDELDHGADYTLLGTGPTTGRDHWQSQVLPIKVLICLTNTPTLGPWQRPKI